MKKIEIKNLNVEVEGKEILKGLNLEINTGEVHVIMGPNGTGKSTLSQVIMGHPKYEVTSGEILVDGENIVELETDERARKGIFLSMQNPCEIPGITNSDFLRTATKELNNEELSLVKFAKTLNIAIDELKMQDDMAHRYLNEGFSGGEKKKNEILQLKMLKPNLAILDEIDSGLDIDALNVVGNTLTQQMEERKNEFSLLLITHYQRLLDYIKPTHVHVMSAGKIVKTGDYTLALEIEKTGYDQYKTEENQTNKKNTIQNCATSMGVNNVTNK